MKKYILLAVMAAALAACGKQQDGTEGNNSASTENAPVYRVATEMLNIPLIIKNGRDDSGFELELIKAIAEKQGMRLEFIVHPWQGIFNTLDNGKSDIVAGAVTYTKDRAESMDLTDPHLEYEFAMLVHEKAADARNFADMRGKPVSLKRDSVAETLIPMFGSPEESNIIRTTTTWEAIKAVLADESMAAVGSSAVMNYYAKQYQDNHLSVLTDPALPKKQYVFAVKKGNAALVRQLNEGLAKVKADGTYNALYKKYWPQ